MDGPLARRSERSHNRAMAFDQAKACELIADAVPLRQVARQLGLSSAARIAERVVDDPEFATQYARAMDARSEKLADEIVEIADDPDLDPNDKRVRVDARKWIASKLKPKKYGDRIQQDVDATVRVVVDDPTKR